MVEDALSSYLHRVQEGLNIQHRTFNVQHRMWNAPFFRLHSGQAGINSQIQRRTSLRLRGASLRVNSTAERRMLKWVGGPSEQWCEILHPTWLGMTGRLRSRLCALSSALSRLCVDEFADAVGSGDVNICKLQLGSWNNHGWVVMFELDYVIL